MTKNILKILLLTASLLALFSACGNWNEILIQRVLRPEEAKEYNVKGTLFYLTVHTDPESSVNGLVVMFRGAPDLSIPVNGGIEGWALDLPTNCTGISRVGLRYSDYGVTKQYWFRDSYGFTARTNGVNYLGRFVIENLQTYDTSFSLRISNVVQKDRARFAKSYAAQTNRPFVFIEPKKETNR